MLHTNQSKLSILLSMLTLLMLSACAVNFDPTLLEAQPAAPSPADDGPRLATASAEIEISN